MASDEGAIMECDDISLGLTLGPKSLEELEKLLMKAQPGAGVLCPDFTLDFENTSWLSQPQQTTPPCAINAAVAGLPDQVSQQPQQTQPFTPNGLPGMPNGVIHHVPQPPGGVSNITYNQYHQQEVAMQYGTPPTAQAAVTDWSSLHNDAANIQDTSVRGPVFTANQSPIAAPLTSQQVSSQYPIDSSGTNHTSPGNGQMCNRLDHTMDLLVFFKHLYLRLSDDAVDGHHRINNPSGFVIYHSQFRPRDAIPNNVTEFHIPLEVQTKINPDNPYLPPFTMPSEAAATIRSTCEDMIGGLHIQYTDGCIYATRYSRTHVFFWANDNQIPQTLTKKLERKQRTLVFDSAKYEKKVWRLSGNLEAIQKERLPVIVFTFGFEWTPSTPLKDSFVHAEVMPIGAVNLLKSLTNNQIEHHPISRNICAGDVNKSMEPNSFN